MQEASRVIGERAAESERLARLNSMSAAIAEPGSSRSKKRRFGL